MFPKILSSACMPRGLIFGLRHGRLMFYSLYHPVWHFLCVLRLLSRSISVTAQP